MNKEQQAIELIGAQLRLSVSPIVLCSFGKDSLVLLHLCLRISKVPVLFFRFAKFHEKHQHALNIMKLWDLEVYDLWPRTATEYQHGSFFEVFHGYSTGSDGVLFLASGLRERKEGESRYLCAIDDLLLRPKAQRHDYPWDVTFHGHKGTDDPEFGTLGEIVNPVSQAGGTRLVVPFIHWSDEDIWSYIRKYDLPYDRQRYDARDESVSPDKYPTCFRCVDLRSMGEMVDCPKFERPLLNIARPESEHVAFREAVVQALTYCEVSGEPRSTPNDAHL
jgi:hypothetical protein